MYEGYLRTLLEPLGVYDLTAGTINGAELYALGGSLDAVSEMLDTVERESLTATAEDSKAKIFMASSLPAVRACPGPSRPGRGRGG